MLHSLSEAQEKVVYSSVNLKYKNNLNIITSTSGLVFLVD